MGKHQKDKPSISIKINGKHICKAGICGNGILDASLKLIKIKPQKGELPKKNIVFHVGGIFDDEFYTWIHEDKLKAGDEIVIKILDSDEIDNPIEISPVGDLRKVLSSPWWRFWGNKH